ncbi:MAG: diacylglycerol kinase [Lacunisphaera sp.]|nr:diacylglycerol kinase [Lacunisphaera sp.]
MRCIVILNEKAGTAAKASPEAVRAACAAAGIAAEVVALPAERIERALREAVASRPDAVAIGGGDGTVRCAAAALADTGLTLGVLPLGTLNHFAKDLKIPADLKAAVAVLAGGVTCAVDVGEVNGHVFINNCSLGAYAEAVRRREALRAMHPQGKWWAMLRASLATWRHLRRLWLRLVLAGETPRPLRTPVVFVGNNRYSGHLFEESLRPRLDEGRLWIYAVRAHRHFALVRLLLRSLVGRLDRAEELATESATEFTIESERGPVPIATDGEVLELAGPLRFRIRPGALRVLVPAGGGER